MSALDTQSEAEIVEAIDTLHGSRPLIVVAHRLATVRRSDRVAFMENGRLTDVGPFGELLSRQPAFRALAGVEDG